MRCPICGAEATGTSLICSKHIGFMYNQYGELTHVHDLVEINFNIVGTTWTPIYKYKGFLMREVQYA